MKALHRNLLLLVLCCVTITANAQTDSTATIHFVRQTGYNGSALHFHCFIDDTLVCNLSNKHYSTHTVAPGEHKINVTVYSKTLKTDKNTLTITAEAGGTYFVKILPGKSYSFEGTLKLLTISESSAKPLLRKSKAQPVCIQ